jgi:release factor glutamine methyltransferase
MPTIAETLKNATEILRLNEIFEPRKEANSLLAFALKKDKTFLIAHSEYELNNDEIKTFENFLQRRASREPFQYITGKQEFYGLDFLVSPDVLIPRPETELIVENALEILKRREKNRFCEVGIGSGCISIAILQENKTASAIACDISEKSLAIARKNAERIGVSDRLELKISDVFAEIEEEKFDLIVSNPPYVPSEDVKSLQREVRDFEPKVALTDGNNGLSIIEKIITDAPFYLQPQGFLLMEIGFDQSSKVREMFSDEIWQTVEFFPDWQGIPRMLKAEIK